MVAKKCKLFANGQVFKQVVLAEHFEGEREGCKLQKRVEKGTLLVHCHREQSQVPVEIVHGLGVGCLNQTGTHLKDRCKFSVVLHIVQDLEDVVVECQQRV